MEELLIVYMHMQILTITVPTLCLGTVTWQTQVVASLDEEASITSLSVSSYRSLRGVHAACRSSHAQSYPPTWLIN